jgi:uncharacterized protein (TIGR03083 family)
MPFFDLLYLMMQPPIQTAHLFAPLDDKLIELLHALEPHEWNAPTVARQWTVKDVAAHLLDVNMRVLSQQDGYQGEAPQNLRTFNDVVQYLNGLNAGWVNAMKRVSPARITQLLALTGKEHAACMAALDPFADAVYSVGWAGDAVSPNWFHVAREYTEKWHHQQQIRDAVNRPGIMTTTFYYPCLDTFMMALPHTYRNTPAAAGTVVQFTITGDGGGHWYLLMEDKWKLTKAASATPVAHTTIDGSVAWKLFTKSWRRPDVLKHVQTEGNQALAGTVLDMIAVMA